MIRIVTEEQIAIVAIEQVKSMFYNKDERKVLIIYNDNTQLECENVIGVVFNNELL